MSLATADNALPLEEFVEPGPDGTRRICLAVPDAYCAACIATIEGALSSMPGVHAARVNLGRRRVQIDFDDAANLAEMPRVVERNGYRNHPLDPRDTSTRDPALRELVSALVVSGFATAHTMFFSEAVWSGVEGDARILFYWLSALVAVPAVAYAGMPFFRSAWNALRAGRANMDVPIAIALIATTAISLVETKLGGAHAYFDASTMLLFFLLIGRTLDHLMRGQARNAAANLARLAPRGALRMLDDGTMSFVRSADIVPGMNLLLRAGDRIPVDCIVAAGRGTADLSLVNGEAMPQDIKACDALPAGGLIVGSALQVTALRPVQDSFLSRTTALMEAVEGARTRYRRIADRAADYYAPVIHIASLATLLAWLALGAGWRTALLNAVSVLIVTCPCALALAVPIVHVVAAGRLFARGILMKDGAALERLADVRHVAFDKTGTLTTGNLRLSGQVFGDPALLSVAAGLAGASSHPLSAALAGACRVPVFPGCVESPGRGVELRRDGILWRLGSAEFCGANQIASAGPVAWLSADGDPVAAFEFADETRPEAASVVAQLHRQGVATHLLSGDREQAVSAIALQLGIADHTHAMTPQSKAEAISRMHETGLVAMVGDGINDAAALRAADVSFAPASAADAGRAAADFVLTNNRLDGVPYALWLARKADRLVRQNLGLSIAYNLVVLPLAAAGLVTPLWAAIAMSSSSMIVVINAMRLRFAGAPSANGMPT
ncbi:heavy metal translocating P-type ATPase [Devosia sp. SL43]|uniref:heavy metal translocating P-type ATPase n=1 Tax=Devosia sp. SL43 TaxID=2806348 RepID=UPI001EFF85D4|nr:heavy metal translocating P-type ATPase [Devosia sp. SL43]UJW85564.1 cadmium-translocating P-type ATPase [Devosia sp. SL43]